MVEGELKMRSIPYLETNITKTNKVFRMAIGDLVSNIIPFKDGLAEQEREVVMAGMDYVTPWTRDASINTWNGAGLLFPEVTKNTLLSVLGDFEGTIRIAGEYWDAIIWAIGAWSQYLYTGDRDFLKTSFNVIGNSLKFFEETEFSLELNLFRGGACYGDGISAYPDIYLTEKKLPGIIDWPADNPELAAKPGVGVTTHVLSTNCLYYFAYVIMGKMAVELDFKEDLSWKEKAENIKNAINKELWDEKAGRYNYFVDKFGGCTYQESMGQSFAILFGVANEEKVEKIFKNVYVALAGIPCVWPTFERYKTPDGNSYGRHSGTVWPHIQGFWAHAAAMLGKEEIFRYELDKLSEHVSRDSHFAEIYHPVTGEVYGGRQEWMNDGIVEWKSCIRQTWSATAYLRMVLMGLIGMDFTTVGIKFKPLIPKGYDRVSLLGLHYRKMIININIEGSGTKIKEFRINKRQCNSYELSCEEKGSVNIDIIMNK
jgi:glycogen debranching enzyme